MGGWTRVLEATPRLGWATEPTPVTPLPSLADELGHAWLGVKRDDLCADLRGGSKVRKLDFLLAAPRYAEVQQWTSLGATGSGHLASLALAAEVLGRDLHAHCFWEDLGPGVLDNLACTTSYGATGAAPRPWRTGLA